MENLTDQTPTTPVPQSQNLNLDSLSQSAPKFPHPASTNYWKISTIFLLILGGIILTYIVIKRPIAQTSSINPIPMIPVTNSPVAMDTPEPTLITTKSQTIQVDSITDWKTYTHNAFTFKYPNSIKVTSENSNIVSLLEDPGQPGIEGFSNGISIDFHSVNLKPNQTLENYVDEQIAALNDGVGQALIEPKQKIAVNGYDGFTYTTAFEGTWRNIFLPSPSSSLVISIVDGTQDPQKQGYRKRADQIISSFKFTN